jgi:hypothetical protein
MDTLSRVCRIVPSRSDVMNHLRLLRRLNGWEKIVRETLNWLNPQSGMYATAREALDEVLDKKKKTRFEIVKWERQMLPPYPMRIVFLCMVGCTIVATALASLTVAVAVAICVLICVSIGRKWGRRNVHREMQRLLVQEAHNRRADLGLRSLAYLVSPDYRWVLGATYLRETLPSDALCREYHVFWSRSRGKDTFYLGVLQRLVGNYADDLELLPWYTLPTDPLFASCPALEKIAGLRGMAAQRTLALLLEKYGAPNDLDISQALAGLRWLVDAYPAAFHRFSAEGPACGREELHVEMQNLEAMLWQNFH